MTAQEVAAALHVSLRTVRRLIDAREIRTVKIGRTIRIHPVEFNAFIARNSDA
jgi:excisionase family DNA binding protein